MCVSQLLIQMRSEILRRTFGSGYYNFCLCARARVCFGSTDFASERYTFGLRDIPFNDSYNLQACKLGHSVPEY